MYLHLGQVGLCQATGTIMTTVLKQLGVEPGVRVERLAVAVAVAVHM
jgi:hypothetical protein